MPYAIFSLVTGSFAHAESRPAYGRPSARAVPVIPLVKVSPDKACTDAIAAAEVKHGIPTGFLLAIAQVESGRLDARSGKVQPWPWTIDVVGQGAFFATRDEAIDAVAAQQALNIHSIDVGCLQVNLQQHPTAFASLDAAFDPVVNADYAARFLVDLQRESGDWTIASGLYHSRTEALAVPYREAVGARFAGSGGVPITVAPPAPRPLDVLAMAWAATRPRQDLQVMNLWPTVPAAAVEANGKPPRRIRLASR